MRLCFRAKQSKTVFQKTKTPFLLQQRNLEKLSQLGSFPKQLKRYNTAVEYGAVTHKP